MIEADKKEGWWPCAKGDVGVSGQVRNDVADENKKANTKNREGEEK